MVSSDSLSQLLWLDPHHSGPGYQYWILCLKSTRTTEILRDWRITYFIKNTSQSADFNIVQLNLCLHSRQWVIFRQKSTLVAF